MHAYIQQKLMSIIQHITFFYTSIWSLHRVSEIFPLIFINLCKKWAVQKNKKENTFHLVAFISWNRRKVGLNRLFNVNIIRKWKKIICKSTMWKQEMKIMQQFSAFMGLWATGKTETLSTCRFPEIKLQNEANPFLKVLRICNVLQWN